MKIKIISVAMGALNGGLLSAIPLFLYNYLLMQNLDMPGGIEAALQGAIGAIFLIFILNIIMLTIIYASGERTSRKSHLLLYICAAWIIATLLLAFTLGRIVLFSEGAYGENIDAAFGVLCSIINFISIIIAAIIANFATKIIKK